MDNWKKIIEGYAKKDDQISVKYIEGVTTSVQEDFKRADVRLITGQTYNNMLNKSSEKLTVGQQIKVGYLTTPSKGWIAMTNGEADPMGGSGIVAEVENAAVVTTNPDDYMVIEELMLDISPETMLYYGNMPSFIIVQGHYCLLSPSTSYVQYTDNHWIVGGTEGLYERIIANKAKFGSQIGDDTRGGFLYGDSGIVYPNRYLYQSLDVYTISSSSSGTSYSCRLNQRYATVNAPSGNWWESTLTWGSFTLQTTNVGLKSYTNTNYLSGLFDIFIIPVVSSFINTQSVSSFQTPYGYCSISGYLVFASADGEHYGVTYVGISSGSTTLSRVPLISDAENCFTLGISQRTEPVYPNSGGGT